ISRRFGGTGLGLAITRHLVTSMQGSIRLESEEGKGTRVSFELPFAIVTGTPHAAPEATLSLAGKRILLVDDRGATRAAMASTLSGRGARVEFACSAEQALS